MELSGIGDAVWSTIAELPVGPNSARIPSAAMYSPPRTAGPPDDECQTVERCRRLSLHDETPPWPTVESIMEGILRGLTHPAHRFEAARMLKRTLVAHPEAKDRACQAVGDLLHLVETADPGRVHALGALQNLVTQHPCSQDAVRAFGGIPRLVELLQVPDLRQPALHVLQCLLHGNDLNKVEFRYDPGIRDVCKLAAPDSAVAAEALRVLQNACTGEYTNKTVTAGIMADLVAHLRLPTYHDALKTIRNVVCFEGVAKLRFAKAKLAQRATVVEVCLGASVVAQVVPLLCSDACVEAARTLASLAMLDTRLCDQIEATEAPRHLAQMLAGPNRVPADMAWVHLKGRATTLRAQEKSAVMAQWRGAACELPVPEAFLCPITLHAMEDPVICDDGMTYEKAAIMEVFSRGGFFEDNKLYAVSPMTRQKMALSTMRHNFALKAAIEAHEATFWEGVGTVAEASQRSCR